MSTILTIPSIQVRDQRGMIVLDEPDPEPDLAVYETVFEDNGSGEVEDRIGDVDGTTVGDPTFESDGLALDGDDHVTLGTPTPGGVDLQATASNPWSAIFVWTPDSAGSTGTVAAKCSGTNERQFQLFQLSGDIELFLMRPPAGGNSTTIGTAVAAANFVLITWDGTDADAWTDPDALADGDATSVTVMGGTTTETEPVLFGARTSSDLAAYLTGTENHAAFYDQALDQSQRESEASRVRTLLSGRGVTI